MHNSINPFYQPPPQWQIRVFTTRDAAPVIEDALGADALATLNFELDDSGALWCVDIITDTRPDPEALNGSLALISGLMHIETPSCEIRILEPHDWVSEVERSFPPLRIGRFFVHGSHVEERPPFGKIALQINAGSAFGSGEHATTSGCLLALGRLKKRCSFMRPLDMGCGSGILAIAMAKLWRVPVLASDIDPVSTTVAARNARINRVHTHLQFTTGDGYRSHKIRACAPYDLITANILARPLALMAPQLAAHLTPGGIAILSGLLASQERKVLAAHRAQGLHLLERICINGWNTLILGK